MIPLPEQRLARLCLRRLCQPAFNGKGQLLYLVGPAGCGKSALLTEFFSESLSSQVPSLRVTASDFAAQLAEASEQGRIPEFQERFRSVSVLACEDLQSLIGRTRSLQQLLAIVDDLLANGSNVIVSSTKRPGELETFPSKLRNRFRGGTLAAINPLAASSRADLLRGFMRARRQTISRDALALLADSIDASPRELAGIATQLADAPQPLRLPQVEEFLLRGFPPPALSPVKVARRVAQEFGLTLAALRSSRRSQALVVPRQCAMWLCRRLCNTSYPQLGDLFARRHSSVLHSIRKLENRLPQDPSLRQRLARLEAACR